MQATSSRSSGLSVTSSAAASASAGSSSTISGRITNNGATPPTESDGTLFLVGAAGDRFPIAQTAGETYSAQVVPGTYAVHYTHRVGTFMPGNANAVLGCVAIDAGGPSIGVPATGDVVITEIMPDPRATAAGSGSS